MFGGGGGGGAARMVSRRYFPRMVGAVRRAIAGWDGGQRLFVCGRVWRTIDGASPSARSCAYWFGSDGSAPSRASRDRKRVHLQAALLV